MERPEDITPDDWRILRSLSDEWILFSHITLPMTSRRLAGRLRSLRSRGLVSHRSARQSDHDRLHVGEWALTGEGDRLVWDATSHSRGAR